VTPAAMPALPGMPSIRLDGDSAVATSTAVDSPRISERVGFIFSLL
jgi:hypothetical protein